MSEESIREIRLQKLARLREIGCDPYRVEKFEGRSTAKQLLDDFEEGKAVAFAGRVVSYRLMGKAGFAHLSDGDAKIQGYFRKDDLGETAWEVYNLLDLGDHIGVRGTLFTTKTGEKSIKVEELIPLSKPLHPLPIGKEKEGQVFSGLQDVDLRYRHRHLDLISNVESRQTLVNRAKITSAVRRYFDGQGYIEVETPILQTEAGGAAARPFVTHYNAYDVDVKLRISLELYLKRLICGDLPKVYEIGRVFRNEGLSNRHNPEFTLLEFYEAYANLETMMTRVEECFRSVAKTVFRTTKIAASIHGVRLVDLPIPGEDEIQLGRWEYLDREFLASVGRFDILECWPKKEPTEPMESERLDSRVSISSSEAQDEITLFGSDLRRPLGLESEFFIESKGKIYVEHVSGDFVVLDPGFYFFAPDEPLLDSDEPIHDEHLIDFSKPWRRVNLLAEIERHTGLTDADLSDLDVAIQRAKELDVEGKARQAGGEIDLNKEQNLGGFIEKLLEVFVEPTLIEPTFVVGYPIETSPLAKKDPNNPRMTRRFEGYVLGREVCNAFSEINDPIDQRERFEQQAREKAKGDDEAHPMDEDFLYALESGMPPTGGCGIGIDRMAMLLTGADHIREVLFFPFMRPQA